jgi:hypothetical protein
MDLIKATARTIYNQTINEIERNYNNFLIKLREYKYGPNPYYKNTIDDVFLFVEKYFEWHTRSEETRYWKSRMFREMIWQGEDIFGPLLHFISYNIYDDGGWNVKWFRDIYDAELEVINREETTEDDWENGYPVLVCEDVTQDPKVILRAMLKYEENKKKEAKYYEKLFEGGW